MQLLAPDNPEALKMFRSTLSEARFARYLTAAGGDHVQAVLLYHWNTELSKSLYGSLQMWEIALRNRLNAFLCWKYGAGWPFDETRFLRQLTKGDRAKVREAVARQQKRRGIASVSTDAIVADLTAGFWVSLLGRSYDTPFVWRNNLARIFPGEKGIARAAAARLCADQLDLRNRVAHHEPIFHLPLEDRRRDLFRLVGALCPVAHTYVGAACTFHKVRAERPVPIKEAAADIPDVAAGPKPAP